MLNTIGDGNTFWLFGGLNLVFLLLTVALIPETKNITLERIEHHLMSGLPLRKIGR